MFVLQALSDPVGSVVTQLKLASIAFCCVQLRDAVSYFSWVNITRAEVEKCKLACLHSFNACVLLFKSVTPTLWKVGYAITRHLQILFDRYGMGLGLNSMQGREAKHVRLLSLPNTPLRLHAGQWSCNMTIFQMFGFANMSKPIIQ